ncbi:hypothetical protein HK28_08510 [Acetobacter sp. DsW_063]|nr:hypothetical protein HK28_08510 [Acetobacter sp. DsW_063]
MKLEQPFVSLTFLQAPAFSCRRQASRTSDTKIRRFPKHRYRDMQACEARKCSADHRVDALFSEGRNSSWTDMAISSVIGSLLSRFGRRSYVTVRR